MSSFTKLGEGAYGCVVKPAVGCDDEIKSGNYVVKYTDERELETQGYRLMAKADPSQEFTIGLIDECFVTPKDQKAMTENCDSDFTYKLISEEGLPLGSFPFIRGDFDGLLKQLLELFLPLFRGIDKLVASKVVHADIKPDNIVVKDGKIRLIDFGLSTTFGKLVEEKNVYGQDYFVWPGDLSFIQLPYKESMRLWNESRIRDQTQPGIFSLTEDAGKFYEKHAADKKLMMRICKTFDLYSLGVTMYRIFRGMGHGPFPFPNNHANVLFRHVCHPDIRERWLPFQAVEYMENLLKSLP